MSNYPKVSEGIFDTVKSNTEQFLEIVGQYFPEAIKDGEVDFTALKEEMGEFSEVGAEHYSFTWAGKQAAKKEAQADILGRTLRFKPEDSVNADTTENIYIEGDNLEALKLLKKNYYGKIKMIYIDPPYNTDSDLIYRDDFTMSDEQLAELIGALEEGNRLQKNPKDGAKYHTNWLNMMYPRLKLAHDLLSNTGAIFIHIDEHEIANLQKLCNLIFGERNELGIIIWDKRNPKGSTVGVAYQHEAIVGYCKNISSFATTDFSKKKEHAEEMISKVESLIKKYGSVTEDVRSEYSKWLKGNAGSFSGGELAYSLIDENGRIFQPVSMAAPDKPETRSHRPLIHPKTNKPCPVPAKGWRFIDSTMDDLLSRNKVAFGEDETTQPRQKYFLTDNLREAVSSLIYFGGDGDTLGVPFSNPKPIEVVKKMISTLCNQNNDIILDFFSGSATSAHAVMSLNVDDGIKRKFIMIQFPELTYTFDKDGNEIPKKSDSSKEAYNAGYRNICEIGKERIRRAAKKIHEDNPDAVFDDGFKVFEVADTNIRWNKINDQDIFDMDYSKGEKDNIDFMPGVNDIDIVYEIMLKQYGIPLSTPIEKLSDISDRTYIFADAVVVCLDADITDELIEKLAAIEPIPAKYILRDSAFDDDIEFKDVSYRRLSALIANHQTDEEKKSKYNNFTVEFI